MEELAHERDQVLWACAAQDPKLLPRKKAVAGGADKLRAMVDRERSDGKVSPQEYVSARRQPKTKSE